MPWVLGIVLKAWQFGVISPRMRLQNSLTKRNFQAWSWISKQEFPQKQRMSRSHCSGSRDRSNQLAEGPHQSKINYGKRFLWLWRIGFYDGGRIEMVLRYCLFDLRNYRACSRPKTRRAKKSYTDPKTEECFQRKTIGSCSRRDACSFLHRHATGDREDNVGWSGDTQEILT